MQVCGAKTRSGALCQNAQMPNGRCRMHGGSQPKGADSPNLKHGRYSRYLNASISQKLAEVEDDNPLDMLPELNAQRALFAEYISRYKEGMKLSGQDMAFMMGWLAEIGRTVERITKLRNETALTAAEVALIAARIPEVVAKFIDDPNQQQAFIRALFAGVGRPANADVGEPQQLPAGGTR